VQGDSNPNNIQQAAKHKKKTAEKHQKAKTTITLAEARPLSKIMEVASGDFKNYIIL